LALDWSQLLNEINELFIKLTRDRIFKSEKKDFLSHVQSCLKLNDAKDWNYILASEDILEDSNEAIINFLNFGLSGPTKYNDLGEKYLRLYGLLNATYQQQQAISNLYKFFQCSNINSLSKKINTLKIRDLRHKLGSHSVNYKDKESGEMHVFVPVRMELNDFKCSYFNHVTDEFVDIELNSAIKEHQKLMCKTYLQVLSKSVKTMYKSNPEKIEKIKEMVAPFEAMLSGKNITKIEGTDEYIIFTVV